MNKIILLGRLVKDPEVKYTQTGKVVAQFTLAVNRPYADKDGNKEADFIPVVAWGKTAEICGNYLAKGQRAIIEGRLQIRSYNASDGSKRYVTEVIAEGMEFVEKKGQQSEAQAPQSQYQPSQPPPQQSYQAPQQNYQAPQQGSAFEDMGTQIPFDETIPF